jgi:hypothetical protein
MEYRDPQHRIEGEVPFLITVHICKNSPLSFTTKIQHSPYCFEERATIPHIVCSGESLLTAVVYFRNFEGLPLLLQGQQSKELNNV